MKSNIVLVTNFYKSNQGKHFTPIKAIKHLAVDTGRSFSSLVSEAVADLLKKYSKKGK